MRRPTGSQLDPFTERIAAILGDDRLIELPRSRPTRQSDARRLLPWTYVKENEREGRAMAIGSGTKDDPWVLKTPPGTSEYTMYRDDSSDPPTIVCQVGGSRLLYDARSIDDLHAWLKAKGDWVPLGGADEQKAAAEGTVEAWGRAADNPIGGWYGLKKGMRGRFGVYLPPLLEALGLAEVSHDPKANRMRAIG